MAWEARVTMYPSFNVYIKDVLSLRRGVYGGERRRGSPGGEGAERR
jgi:hypothetical protein